MTEKLLMQAENDIYRIVLRPDGIIHVHYKKGAKVTVDILKELAGIYTSMTKIDRPYIFTGDEFVSITNEAR